uniref:sensor N-terminal transmembrane domain-containing protein n=1 Tax=Sphingomonas bacterium TaxID=1895847 RepID=UPI0015766959
MGLATVSRKGDDPFVGWFGRLTLTGRILAVNVFALGVLAGSFLYIDSYRSKLIDDRIGQAAIEVRMAAAAVAAAPPVARAPLMARLGIANESRLRLYPDADGAPIDSWASGPATYELRDPRQEPWRKRAARAMDRLIDTIVGAERP